MLNSVNIMGRFTDFPTLKTTQSGKSVVSFTIAVNDNYSKDKTSWIDCVAWNKTAEHISTYYTKGSLICVEGEIQTRTYDDKNGKKHKVTEVIVNKTHFCEKKQDVNQSKQNNDVEYEETDTDEDLPF